MKTLFTFALAGALSFSSLAANAADDLMALSDVKAKFKKVNVLLRGGVGEAKISLFDHTGRKLHQRKVTVGELDLILPYNLNELPTGEYQVKISTDEEQVVYKVETFEQPIATSELPLAAYGKVVDDQTINIAVMGLDEPGVDVEIRSSEDNKVIFEEEINQSEGFRKNYKLKGVSPEDVYIQVTDSKGRSKTLHF
ncbi:T9SS C-terminal target domain-containing protein [Algoriphagus lacus]|uniref:T9SS C-terminal target domain-containing protein n=1 Tax=Algoriphagus lacus TaxID=2056311 RepID=A0A418PQF8_9BACT|nr:T9SS type A sorting domain-containing protein [Algoriphagus lacus]RIW14465.1 T9SS C-terminal target domain-containing protein [Algoriphagus lacus]